jgi:hypothetical protein
LELIAKSKLAVNFLLQGICFSPRRSVAAGIHHHYKHGTDDQRRERARARVNDRHAHGKDDKERADEFNEIFFHKSGIANFRPVNPGPRLFASEKIRPAILFIVSKSFSRFANGQICPREGRRNVCPFQRLYLAGSARCADSGGTPQGASQRDVPALPQGLR